MWTERLLWIGRIFWDEWEYDGHTIGPRTQFAMFT